MNESHHTSNADSAPISEAVKVPPSHPAEMAPRPSVDPAATRYSDDPAATRYSDTPAGAPNHAPADDPHATRYRDAGTSGGTATPAVPTIPGYEILGELGRGGMGVVYKARHLRLDRVVALKMILVGGHAGQDELARFKTEAEAVARLQHPNIVQIFEVGEHAGLPFFSLEFVEGGSLDKKLNGTPVAPRQAAQIVETLARALQAAHEAGVVHRDVKPANVLIGAKWVLKITDFGLAKKLDAPGGTQSGAVMGTPSYMAPEQASGKSKEIGPAADVYAMGAILYELLTGRPPFKAASALDTVLQVVADEPVPPRQLQSKTPRDLETICLKCLEKQPGRRYATAEALAEDLGRWLRGEPVRAQPPSWGYVLGKQISRNRTPLTVAAGMMLLLAAVVTTAFVLLLGAWGTAQKNFETAERQLSVSARIAAGRSDAEHRAGNLRDSLSWMLQAYELAPHEDAQRPGYVRLIGDRGRGLSDRALWHEGPVWTASFSPDGRTVLTASLDKTARLWDAQSGKELRRLPHEGGVWSASFSPDGRTVLTACFDKIVRLWDAQSGELLQELPHAYEVKSASFSPDGHTVVTVPDFDKTARLWDAQSGKQLQRLTHDGRVKAASFSPDGRTVLTASRDKTARLWDAASGKELLRLPHEDWVMAASFSPDGRTVLTASRDKTARLWDAQSGKELQRLTHDGGITAAAFSPDGRTVVTASEGNTARLWDAQSGKQLQRLTPELGVKSASISPDGRTVLTVGGDTALWDAASGKELERLTQGVGVTVEAASFSPDGRTVVTAGLDKTARLWDIGFLSVPDNLDPDRLRAWALVRTGQDFTEDGELRPLSPDEWQRQRQILDAKGGDWQPHVDQRQWHLAQAAVAEVHEAWFAARFHLNRLLLTDPNNADLLRRRNEAEAHLKAP